MNVVLDHVYVCVLLIVAKNALIVQFHSFSFSNFL